MPLWVCGIAGCGTEYGSVEALIQHQTSDHRPCECKVCGETMPAGFVSIQHAFDQHTRAEYVRAYDADSDDIRLREQVKEFIEDSVDVPSLLNGLEFDEEPAASVGD